MKIERYDLDIDLNDRDYTFEGSERISLEGEGKPLILNAVDLEIRRIRLNGEDTSFSLDPAGEELSVKGPLKGNTIVEIEFAGKISRTLTGFYLAKGADGEIFTTQFESSGARRTFPCLDHPAYKARFSLSLTVRDVLDTISNMPVKSVRQNRGKKTITFEETPRMSTYLLYIGVGLFDRRAERVDGKEIVLIAPKGHLTTSHFPLEIAAGSLRFFEDYFAIPYALPLLQLISVPQFAAGAMENWGAITMREVFMDIGPSTSSRTRKSTAEVIAHEIVHQWFGNLVTMKWWNDLWLNESFATFMAYEAVHSLFPEWDSWGDFVLYRMDGALKGDALVHSHPIDVEVTDPESVAQIFDEISYGKGGSILRMIESYMGKEAFRDSIRSYLQKHAYENATGEDLWKAMEEVSRQPVNDIMQAWTKNQGYPLVTVTRKGNKLHLEQEQFLLFGNSTPQHWPIPITLKRGEKIESVLFRGKELDLDATDFLKLNVDQTGFYRVHYDERTLANILSTPFEFSNLDRWGISNDLYALLISGRLSLLRYFDHLRSLGEDPTRLVVEEIANQLSRLGLLLTGHSALAEFSKKFFRAHLDRLGERKRTNEAETDSILRGILSRELSLVDPEFASKLSGLFGNFHEIDPDMRSAVSIAEALTRNDFIAFRERLASSSNDEDRTKLIGGMGWLHGTENLTRVIELIQTEQIKKQDSFMFYISASANPRGREFMVDHLEFAVKQMQAVFVGSGTTARTLEQIIPLLGLSREDRLLQEVGRFRAPDTEVGIRKGTELLRIYSTFVNKYKSY